MARFGKWIGLGLGWALGGPIGGILGLAVGSIFDTGTTVTSKGRVTGTTTLRGDYAASWSTAQESFSKNETCVSPEGVSCDLSSFKVSFQLF